MSVGNVGPYFSFVLPIMPAVSKAHSEGMKYLTPASIAALTRAICLTSRLLPGKKEVNTMTTIWP